MFQTWFECKVKYVKVAESGKEESVTEAFLFDAVSYTDAEARVTKEMLSIVKGGVFSIQEIKKTKFAEIFPFEAGEWWFKMTANLVTVDEEAGKEKKLRSYYLIMADEIKEALTRLDESLDYLIIPFVVSAVSVSKIVDVFPYVPEAEIPEGFVPVEK
jgi:hypothetical protein